MVGKGKELAKYLETVTNWHWSEFCREEMSGDLSADKAVMLSFARICAEGKKPSAIELALDRLSGKIAQPVEIRTPQIYLVYPYAESVVGGDVEEASEPTPDVVESKAVAKKVDLATLSIRETVKKMGEESVDIVAGVLKQKHLIEDKIRRGNSLKNVYDPYVKSVIAANFLRLAIEGDLSAIYALFDQIDGKIAKIIEVVGDDVELIQYDSIAPIGSIKDANGVYRKPAISIQNEWSRRLDPSLLDD